MPKKTKKAKLIAEYRRKLHQLDWNRVQSAKENSAPIDSSTLQSTYILPKQLFHDKPKTDSLSLPQSEFKLIQKDLHYTLGIIVLFFIIEFILWNVLK